MPGKHAPESPRSFIMSLARSGAGALGVLGVVVLIAVIAVSSQGDQEPGAAGTGSSTPTESASVQPTRTTKPSRTPSPRQTASVRPRGEVAVQVLNGNGRTGAAGAVSSRVEEDGYQIVEPGNSSIINRTIIYYDDGYEAEARELRDRLFDYVKDARIRAREPGTGDASASIVVIIGRDQPA